MAKKPEQTDKLVYHGRMFTKNETSQDAQMLEDR